MEPIHPYYETITFPRVSRVLYGGGKSHGMYLQVEENYLLGLRKKIEVAGVGGVLGGGCP